MKITYAKLRSGNWGVRAEGGDVSVGDVVTVSKKDGTKKFETISHIVWKGNGVTLCAIRSRSRYSYRSSYGYDDRCPCNGGDCACGSDAPCCMCE